MKMSRGRDSRLAFVEDSSSIAIMGGGGGGRPVFNHGGDRDSPVAVPILSHVFGAQTAFS